MDASPWKNAREWKCAGESLLGKFMAEETAKAKPKHYSPKLLPFKESKRLADLESIERDLEISKSCFAIISRSGECPIQPSAMFVKIKESNLSWPVFVAGVITYRRCFSPAVRNYIRSDELEPLLSEAEKSLHVDLIDVASKHVAHSVNGQELNAVTLEVAYDTDKNFYRGSLGRRSLTSSSFANVHFASMISLIDKIIAQHITPSKQNASDELQKRIDQMTDQEIQQLPDGFPPQSEQRVSFKANRKWPPVVE